MSEPTIAVLGGDQTGQELLEEALRVLDPDVTRCDLTFEHYDLSMRIGARLFERLRSEEFHAATTECSACRMQIEHGTGKPCYHPLHLLDHAAFGTPLPG